MQVRCEGGQAICLDEAASIDAVTLTLTLTLTLTPTLTLILTLTLTRILTLTLTLTTQVRCEGGQAICLDEAASIDAALREAAWRGEGAISFWRDGMHLSEVSK